MIANNRIFFFKQKKNNSFISVYFFIVAGGRMRKIFCSKRKHPKTGTLNPSRKFQRKGCVLIFKLKENIFAIYDVRIS